MKTICCFALSLFFTFSSFSQASFKVGDKAEAYNVGWYKATVIEIGSGSYAGYYKVHYDDYSSASDQYLKASSVRPRKNAAVAAAKNSSAGGPRTSKYLIMSYGANSNPLHLGYFTLTGSGYTFLDMGNKKIGSGNYTYNAATKQVKWVSGPFSTNGFTGDFEVTREGKTHNIKLKRGTFGTNSTD
ncbi:MAG: hypothetical protein WKF88_10115 [Ferruginibacter sp.]